MLVRIKSDGQPELVTLEKVRFARAELPNPAPDVAPKAGKRGTNRRLEAITDIAYTDGKLLVAGLSNEEFASTLRCSRCRSVRWIAARRWKFIMAPMARSKPARRFGRSFRTRWVNRITCSPRTRARRWCNLR